MTAGALKKQARRQALTAAALRQRVYGLTAAKFTEALHPRGKDGKFIEIGGIIKLLGKGLGKDKRGGDLEGRRARVHEIREGEGGKPEIVATLINDNDQPISRAWGQPDSLSDVTVSPKNVQQDKAKGRIKPGESPFAPDDPFTTKGFRPGRTPSGESISDSMEGPPRYNPPEGTDWGGTIAPDEPGVTYWNGIRVERRPEGESISDYMEGEPTLNPDFVARLSGMTDEELRSYTESEYYMSGLAGKAAQIELDRRAAGGGDRASLEAQIPTSGVSDSDAAMLDNLRRRVHEFEATERASRWADAEVTVTSPSAEAERSADEKMLAQLRERVHTLEAKLRQRQPAMA